MKELKKKILIMAFALIFVAMLAAPVLAAPATKIEGVTLTEVTTPVRMTHPGYPRIGGGIMHSKGNTTNTAMLTIPGFFPDGSDLILTGTWFSEWNSKACIRDLPDPEAKAMPKGRVWLTVTGGTFEGNIYRTITGLPISGSSTTYTRIVLHGTGDYLGWTVKLIDGEGSILIPK